MKITVYTTTDCQFSKQEKDYLASNNLQYEEKNLETNKDFLTEMLAVSNNFAGTPITRVEKDDGTIVVLKGFTKEEFDTTFGLTLAPSATPEPVKAEEPPVKPVETPIEQQQASTPTEPVVQTPVADPKLDAVLDKLEDKTETVATPQTDTTVAPPIPPAPLAEETTPNATSPSPTVPDFPGK